MNDVGATKRVNADGSFSYVRDPVDARIVNDVINGTGKIVCGTYSGSQGSSSFQGNCTEGVDYVYPNPASGTPPQDIDKDGMPDVWEVAQGFNANNLMPQPCEARSSNGSNITKSPNKYSHGISSLNNR